MAKANYYQFAIFGIAGVNRIEVVATNVPEAVKTAEEWELDGQRPIKVELISSTAGKYEMLGTE
jgi:hypothetical protein